MIKGVFIRFNSRIWIKVLMPVSFIVIIVVAASLWFNLSFQNRLAMDQLRTRNHTLAKAIEGGMFDALAVGDNETVRAQFARLREKTDDLMVFVYDFNGVVSFSTEAGDVGRAITDRLDEAAGKKLAAMLETGRPAKGSVRVRVDGTDYLVNNDPILNEKRCFHCHGSSRKVLGGTSVFSSMASVQADIRSGRNQSLLIGLAGLGMIILFVWIFFHFMVNKQVSRILDDTARLRQKDFTHSRSVPEGDEMHHILARIDRVTRELGDTIREIKTNSGTIFTASEQLSRIAENLDDSSSEASEMAASVSAAADEMSNGNRDIATAMEQATDALTTIAAAVDEMSATVGEIAKNATASRDMTAAVSGSFKEMLSAVEALGSRVGDVDEVTDEIRGISGQVSLLALNAKIEAARAGEYGKGFAVVAQEITDLAAETGQSTVEADEKLRWIKQASEQLSERVHGLAGLIRDADTAISGIAAAVEEQSATTREISQNINEVSDNISQVNHGVDQGAQAASAIARDIGRVEKSAGRVREESARVNENAARLSAMAETFMALMKSFKV